MEVLEVIGLQTTPLSLLNAAFHIVMASIVGVSTYLTGLHVLNLKAPKVLVEIEKQMLEHYLILIGVFGTVIGALIGFQVGGDETLIIVTSLSLISTSSAILSIFMLSIIKGMRSIGGVS